MLQVRGQPGRTRSPGTVLLKVGASLSLPHCPVAFPPSPEELPAGLESRYFSSGFLFNGIKLNTTFTKQTPCVFPTCWRKFPLFWHHSLFQVFPEPVRSCLVHVTSCKGFLVVNNIIVSPAPPRREACVGDRNSSISTGKSWVTIICATGCLILAEWTTNIPFHFSSPNGHSGFLTDELRQ